MFNPTTEVKNLVGWVGILNIAMARRNELFASWLKHLVQTLNNDGVALTVDYLAGGTNQYFTLPDQAILQGGGGYRILVSLTVMERLSDPVNWVKQKLLSSPKDKEPQE